METCDALLRQLHSAPGKVPLGSWLFPRSPRWPGKEVTRTASDLCLVLYTEISNSLPILLFPKACHPFPHSKAHIFIIKGQLGNQEKAYHNLADNCPAKKCDGLRKKHSTWGFWFKTVALVHGTSSVPWGIPFKICCCQGAATAQNTWGWRGLFWEGPPCPAGPGAGLRAHRKDSGQE